MEGGTFTFDQLWALPEIDKTNNDSGWVYMILYRRCRFLGGRNAWYIGKSESLPRRYKSHKRNIDGPREPIAALGHYRIARSAEAWRMIPLARFNIRTPNLGVYLRLAEQTFNSLFLSWNKILFLDTTRVDELMRGYQPSASARFLNRVARIVFEETGWPVMDIDGCNWNSPLTEPETTRAVMYTSVVIPGSPAMTQYRRSSLKVSSNMELFILGGTTLIPVVMPGGHGIRPGMRVHVVCEIVESGEHPVPYCRYPSIGAFTDWSDCKRLGMLLETLSLRQELTSDQAFEQNGKPHQGNGKALIAK
jgi:hypothetical protein